MSFTNTLRKKEVRKIAWILLAVSGLTLLGFWAYALTNISSYPLSEGESVASWQLPVVYSRGSADEERVLKETEALKRALGEGQNEYELLVGIASQYEVLGDGRAAYMYLSRAIAKDPQKGLAYFTLARLMERLGAPATALSLYTEATKREPSNELYRTYREMFAKNYQQ